MVIIWSFSFVVVDIAVEFMPASSIALYRFIIASLTFVIIDIYLKIRKKKNFNNISDKSGKFTKNDWLFIIMASISGVSLFFFAQYTAIEIIGPSLPALFVCLLAPVVITILALIFFKEKLNFFKIIGFIIASIGGFLLVTGGNLDTLTPDSPNFIGYIFALITPILWGIYSTVTKKITENKSSIVMLKYIAYIGTIELLILVLANNEFFIFLKNFFNIIIFLCGIYLGILSYIIGGYIWQNSQATLKSSKVASFLYIEPFITLLFSFLLKRSEIIVIWNIIGGIIVLVAVFIINYK
ncbi:MAG: DMT family transporter [Promethearchaeota archaeon]|jgi:drug/metabolite transporter (DMT)-like permease